MLLRLTMWAVASAGHIALLAGLLNRSQGYAISPKLLHPFEKGMLALIGLGPLVALGVPLFLDPLGEGILPAIYRVWALGGSVFFFGWALQRWVRQAIRARWPGPILRRRRLTKIDRDEALHRRSPTWRAALAIPRNEALSPHAVRTRIRLPTATRPRTRLRLLHLSDFHLTGIMSRAFYRPLIEAAIEQRPDAIFVTGDLVEVEECLDWVEDVFGPLAKAAPTYFVLGNHDSYLPDPDRLVERLTAAGLVSLTGRRERLEVREWRIDLLGDSAPWFAGLPTDAGSTPAHKIDDAGEKSSREIADGLDPCVDLTLALVHSPDRWDAALAAGADLTLAGHTHGGQIRIPVLGPVFCPSKYGARYSRGWFERDGRRMFVHQGIGGVIPVRYLCPPEVVRIEVLPASEAELPAQLEFDARVEPSATPRDER